MDNDGIWIEQMQKKNVTSNWMGTCLDKIDIQYLKYIYAPVH